MTGLPARLARRPILVAGPALAALLALLVPLAPAAAHVPTGAGATNWTTTKSGTYAWGTWTEPDRHQNTVPTWLRPVMTDVLEYG